MIYIRKTMEHSIGLLFWIKKSPLNFQETSETDNGSFIF